MNLASFHSRVAPGRPGIVALAACGALVLLSACRDMALDTPTLHLGVQGTTVSIRIENRTAGELQVPANFLDRTRRHELALAVSTERGTPVAMCRDVAYVDGADLRRIAPKATATIEVDATTVMQTHCLESGRPYRLQAVLVGGAQPGVAADVRSNPILITLNAPAAAE